MRFIMRIINAAGLTEDNGVKRWQILNKISHTLILVVIIMLYFCKNKGINTGKQIIQEWPHYLKLFFPGSENGRRIDNEVRRQAHNNTSSEYSLDQALDVLFEEYSDTYFLKTHKLLVATMAWGKFFCSLTVGMM